MTEIEILKKLAQGGMATVHLARRYGPRGVEQHVALKRPSQEIVDDDEHLAAFADEARLLMRLSHPNIVSVIGLEERRTVPWLLLEYVDGVTLAELLRRATKTATGRLPRDEAVAIALSLAEALAYVHAHLDELDEPLGVVHRDVTPANVMVSFDGAVKLIDFGIASAASHEVVTRTGVVKGTPGFMAPEQLRGEKVDYRADLYAFGATFYMLLVGSLPWSDDIAAIVAATDPVPGSSPPRPSDRVEGVDPDLDALISSCLAFSPEARPTSMAEVRDRIANALAQADAHPTMGSIRAVVRALVPSHRRSEPATMLAPKPRRRTATWIRRHVLPTIALAAIGALAYAAGRWVSSW